MSPDRLKELKRGAAPMPPPDASSMEVEHDKASLVSNQVKGGMRPSQSKSSDFMQDFFSDVERVKANIVQIREATEQILDIDQNMLQATSSEREQEFTSQMMPLVDATNKRAKLAKQMLQRLREDTEELKKAGSGKQTPEVRIRENLSNTLTRKFVDVMKDYQNAQTRYKTDIKKKVKRQVQIVKPDATTEEIDAVMQSGGGSGDILKNSILTGEAADAVRNALTNVQDKYQDVLKLEKSVVDLHQMFLDFALLTEQQGELLDQIEFQVKEASDFVDQGNVEMVEAISLAKSIRAKQCLIALIVIVILGIIAGIIAAKASGSI